MYTSRFTRWSAHLFDNGEVFVTVAVIHEAEREIEWFIPQALETSFSGYIARNAIEDPYSEKTIDRIGKHFSETLGIDTANVSISVSLDFSQGEGPLPAADTSGILYNKTDPLPGIRRSTYADIYDDENQHVTAKIEDGGIVSIAFDNGNGAVTVETAPGHRKKGYSTLCLSRLIGEYRKMGRKIGFGTTMANTAAIRVAEKCGMIRLDPGYWIRIHPSVGKELYDKNPGLFESQKK